MASGNSDRTTPPTLLPLDEEVSASLAVVIDEDADEEERGSHESLLARLEDPVARLGLGRALIRILADEQHLDEELAHLVATLTEEYEELLHPLRRQRAFIETVFEAAAPDLRVETNGKQKSMKVPGIGVWSTSSSSARFETVDQPAIVAMLDGDDRETYTDQPEPPPRKLLGKVFRDYLLATYETAVEDIPDDEPERRAELGNGIAAAYGAAVEFHPDAVGLRGYSVND